MPAAKAGESKQALVVTLVFFILLSLILGVLTYMGYSGQDQIEKDKQKALQEKKQFDDEAQTSRAQAMVFRSYMGDLPKDAKELPLLHDRAASKDDKDGNQLLVKNLETSFGWDKAKGLPQSDMKRVLAEAKKQKDDALKQLADTKEELGKRMREAQNAKKARDGFEVDYKKKLEEVNDQRKADLKQFADALAKQMENFGDQSKQIAALQEEIDNLKKNNDKVRTTKDKEIKGLNTQILKLADRKPKYNPATLEGPKGKIVLMDRSGTMPYINLGSADHARPQLTFAVHGVGADGRPLKESKGSIEVTHVVNSRLSQCRITEQRDATRDPIAAGDVILNPAWDPNAQRHVAIAGIVDLTGKVRKDRPTDADRATKQFIRALENQNIVVDAWIDFTDNSIKGKGITRDTDFLIQAPLPEGQAGTVKEDDAKTRRRDDIHKLAAKMGDEATKMGVAIIKARDFLSMTGFPPPRATEEDNLHMIHKALPAVASPIQNIKPLSDGEDKEKEKEKAKDKDK